MRNKRIKNGCADEVWSAEFLGNLTHPGKKIEFSTKDSEDLCSWLCRFCGETWDAYIFTRTNNVRSHCQVP